MIRVTDDVAVRVDLYRFGRKAHLARDTAPTMSQQNVELVLALYDAFNRRDEDALVALCDPEVEILSFAAAVEGSGTFVGHDGAREWHRKLVGTLSIEIEPGAFLPYRSYVMTIPLIHIRAGDGLATTYEQGIVYEIRNGLILRSLGYKDAATAFVNLGRLLQGSGPENTRLPE